MLLEEARLRCRSLLDHGDDSRVDLDGLSLNGLHGDLGTAGYYASARLDALRCRQLLAQARARSQRRGSGEGPVRALVDVTGAATRTVERALAATGLLDHMHLAYIHVMSACDALYALFAVQA